MLVDFNVIIFRSGKQKMTHPCSATPRAAKTATDTFQEFDFEVDRTDYRPGVLKVLAAIRPQWKAENICICEMEKGFLNFLVKCSATSADADDYDKEKVIVRVFGPVPFHRESEVHLMRLLHGKGIIMPLYCRFKNGIAYQYAPGQALSREQFKDDKILKLIATKMHSIHQIDVTDYIAKSGRPPLHVHLQKIFSTRKIPDFPDNEEKQLRCNQNLPSQEQFVEHLKEWNEIYKDLSKRSPSVFAHFDLQASNIIYDDKKDTIALVDWECCNIEPEIVEVATLVAKDLECTGVFNDSASMKQWLKVYLSTHPSHGKEPLTEDLLQKWYRDSIQASLWISFTAVSFFIGQMQTSQITNQLPLDFFGLAIKSYERFKAYKRELEMMDAK